MSRVVVPATGETDVRQSYMVTELRYGTEYGFRLYSSNKALVSRPSTFVFVTTTQKG